MATPKKAATKRAPRKAKVYVEEQVIPVVKRDIKNLFGLPKWLVYAIGGIVIFLLLKLFVIDSCNKAIVTKNQQKVQQLEQQVKDRDQAIIEMRDSMAVLDKIFEDLYNLSTQATEDRKQSELEGEQIRNKSKIITDEIKAKISNPNNTDSDRDAIERELLRAREAAKVSAAK